MKLAWAALSALSLGACSFIYDGEGLVGPGPDAGANADATADAATDALDEKAPVVLDGETGLTGVAVDATFLYWSTEAGRIVRKAREGSASEEEIASGEAKPGLLAIDNATVYWATTSGIRRRALGGGAVETFATTTERPAGLTIQPVPGGSVLYWTERNAGVLKAKTVTGGPENVIADKIDRPGPVAMASRLHIVVGEGQITSQTFSGTISPTNLVEGRRVSALAGTSTVLYFVSQSTNSIGSYNTASSNNEIKTILDNVLPPAIASDGAFLFFVEGGARIRRLTL